MEPTNAKTLSGSNAQGQDSLTNELKNTDKSGEINSYLDRILAHAAKGWPVFPCKQDKTPYTKHGHKDASSDPEQIRAWWATWPDALVGVATGEVSGIWALDIDCKNGAKGPETIENLVEEYGFIPDTYRIETRSGGYHLYFNHVEGLRNSASKIGPGIDVRADGGYVIVPPSPGYRVTLDAPIVDAPQWLIDLAMANKVPPVAKPAPESIHREKPQGDVIDRAREYIAKPQPSTEHEAGHSALFWVARVLVWGFLLPDDVAFDLLSEYNQRGDPETDYNLRHKIREAGKGPFGKPRGWLLNEELPTIAARPARYGTKKYEGPVAVGELAAVAERYLGKSIEESDGDHAKILVGIIDAMLRRGLAVDALNNFRDVVSWSRVSCDPVAFAEDLAFNLRRDGMKVDAARVGETFRTLARVDATKRRQDLTSTFLGKPTSQAGLIEVRRWIRAVTGDERPADIAAMLHWLWLVKNRVAGRHGELHLMIVVFGLMQGTGKSQAVLRLCTPWAELFDPEISIETITDERNAPHLANCAVGLWDELGGLAKADMEKLKHRMTATTVAYRPMRTNSRIELPALMSFIGSSNRSIGELVKDSTGMRRFYEIRASDVIDWDEINTIDYALLWQAINEDEDAPGIIHRQIIAAEQLRLVWTDPIQRWIEDEADAGWQSTCGLDGVLIPAFDPKVGATTASLYGRLRAWCAAAGERELSREAMGRRLSELGWVSFRLPRSQGQTPSYRQLHPIAN